MQERGHSAPEVYTAGLDTPVSLRAGTGPAAAEEARRIAEHICARGQCAARF